MFDKPTKRENKQENQHKHAKILNKNKFFEKKLCQKEIK